MPRSARSSRRRPRCSPARAATYQALISLLAVSGIRIGEAIGLDDEDFDEGRELLVVRHAKYASTAWCRCTQRRARPGALCRAPAASTPESGQPALFLSTAGTRLWHSNIGLTFAGLAEQPGSPALGIVPAQDHDLRHSFAVNTVLGWYRDGADIAALMPRLSTYLGHNRSAAHLLVLLRFPGYSDACSFARVVGL